MIKLSIRAGTLGLACLLGLAATVEIAHAERPPLWLDEAETDFRIQNTYDTKDGVQFNPGWALKVRYVLRGTEQRQPGSMLRFTVKQGKTKSELLCAIPAVQTDYASDVCYDTAQRLKLVGTVTVDAAYVDGATDAVTPLRSYQLLIKTATQIRGNLAPAASQQYVSWHGRLLENFLVLGSQHRLELWVRYATPYETGIPSELDTALFCSVDGTLLPPPTFDWLSTSRARSLEEQVIARTAEVAKASQNQYRKVSGHVWRLPITWGPEDQRFPGMWVLDDHPGQWACTWKHKGKPLRVFRFQVAGGQVVPHAEQAAGLNLVDGMTLVDMTIPPDSLLDDAVVPDELKTGSFFGRPWATAEGKAMAAAVKAKGTAHYPQPKQLDFGKPIKKWAFAK